MVWQLTPTEVPRMVNFVLPAPQILGEQLVLAANDDSLRTVALRPSGIFGEGDPIFVPTVVKQVEQNLQLCMQVRTDVLGSS
jgi:nucleoside-diphosphate-sugar epimerase